MAQIVESRIDGRIRQAAEESDEPLGFRIAPKISLCQVQGQIIGSRIRGSECDPPAGKNAQVVQPRFRSEQSAAGQNLRGVESQSAVAERLGQSHGGHESNASQSRFVFEIPKLQRGFKISFEKIDGGQKFLRVRVVGIQVQCRPQVLLGKAKIFLFVGEACQLHGKPRIARRLSRTRFEGHFRLVPFLQLGESGRQVAEAFSRRESASPRRKSSSAG